MRGYLFALLCCAAVADFVVPKNPENSDDQIVIKTRNEPFVVEHAASTHEEHHLYPSGVTKSQYVSPTFTLKTGEAWFSLPDVTTLKMPQPGKPYAIIAAQYDIVDRDTKKSVPLNEMYSHHWLVYDRLVGSDGFNVGCGGYNTWVCNIYGAGGELRGIMYIEPEGYGHVIPGNRHWSANMHFIRTEDLSAKDYSSEGAAIKACIECDYHSGKGITCVPGLDGAGIFGCCFDGCRCPVNNPKDKTTKGYQLIYNITWTTDVETVKPVRTYVIDGFSCGILENLIPNRKTRTTECDDKLCLSKVTRKMPKSGTIYWAYTHQHNGATNTTLLINGVPACTSYPRIGHDVGDTPGDEKGYLVGFRMCVDPSLDPPLKIKKGDELTLLAHASVDAADTRFLPIPGGKHTGFMHLFYFFYHEGEDADTYSCVTGRCVPEASGVPLKTCQAACGTEFENMMTSKWHLV
jgi:hypothetical protein